MKQSIALGTIALCAFGITATAADWPQFRGPNHDGSSPESILKNWPAEGLEQHWKAPLGDSFGALTVSGGRVFAFIQRRVDGQDREVAIALDAQSGRELWARPLGEATYDRQGGDGPRSTPTAEGDRVYLLGAYQVLTCLDAATGEIVWQRDLVKEFDGRVIRWNNAASPIIEGDLIFVNAGGQGQALLAFHTADGELAWKGEDDLPTHSSPVPTTIHGMRQIIFFTQTGLVSVAPETGNVLWRQEFPFSVSTAMSPVVHGDIVFCSAGYGVGGGAYRISKRGEEFVSTELWRHGSEAINHWTTPVAKDGYMYGIFGFRELGRAPLQCIELATGRIMWSQPGFGSGGATVLVDGHVLVQADRGPLVLVEATPSAYTEVARTQPLGGKCWTMPVISHGRIYARNTEEAVSLNVSPQTAGR